MSKLELKIWLWLLGVSGISAALMFVLPVGGVILLMYMFVGMVMLFCPFIFLYSLCIFTLNALMALVMRRPFWLRTGISVAVVVAVAHLVSGQLNVDRTAAYNRVAAMDVPLAAKPTFSRLVLIDSRPGREYKDWHDECGEDCAAYLANRAATAVLIPSHSGDTRPFTQRSYRVFTQTPGCPQPKMYLDAISVMRGSCLAPETQGSIAAGDLILHLAPIKVPFQTRKCLCERLDVYLMTAAGPTLIERQTSFQMSVYGDMPVPARDAGWNGSYYDHGISWISSSKMQRRYYGAVVKDDLGLSPDVRTVADDVRAAREAKEGPKPRRSAIVELIRLLVRPAKAS